MTGQHPMTEHHPAAGQHMTVGGPTGANRGQPGPTGPDRPTGPTGADRARPPDRIGGRGTGRIGTTCIRLT